MSAIITSLSDIPDVTFKEALQALRVSRSTLYRWIHECKVMAYKIGGRVRFFRNDILALVDHWDVIQPAA